MFPLTKVYHLKKFGSDHRPLLLQITTDNMELRPSPPFRCQAAWVLEEGFLEIIQHAWQQGSSLGSVKEFTFAATAWNKERVGNLTWKKRNILKRIEGVERARK